MGNLNILPPATKTVAAVNTPEAIGAATGIFTSITFVAEKAVGTNNTGVVRIQFAAADGIPGIPLQPGEIRTFNCVGGKELTLDKVFCKVLTSGDGVSYQAVR